VSGVVEASRSHTSLLQKVAPFAMVHTRSGRRTDTCGRSRGRWYGPNRAACL